MLDAEQRRQATVALQQTTCPPSLFEELLVALSGLGTSPEPLDDPFLIERGRVLSCGEVRVQRAQALPPSCLWRAQKPEPFGDVDLLRWSRLLPLADGQLAFCDSVMGSVRHSGRAPTYAFAAICFDGFGPICIGWPLAGRAMGGSAPREHGSEGAASKVVLARAEVTRNYVDGRYSTDSQLHRALYKLPWLSHPMCWSDAGEYASDVAAICMWTSEAGQQSEQARHGAELASLAGGRLPSSASTRQVFLGWVAQQAVQTLPLAADAAGTLRVFTDLPQIRTHLSHARFKLVESRTQADVLWLGEHLRDFASLAGGPLLNQFPHESCLTSKNLLSECVAAQYGRALPWMADSFTLPQQLPVLVIHWHRVRQCSASPPLFILKPWSSSRSRGHLLCDQLAAALVACTPTFGPRLACRYVERPVLLDRRKWDMRVYVAVRSLSPPEVFVSRQWYARVANVPYEGAPLDVKHAHFTVLRYDGVAQDMWPAEETVARFEDVHGVGSWRRVWARVRCMLALVTQLLVVRASSAPFGTGQCRAMYGIDVLFAESADWQGELASGVPAEAQAADVQPVLLEVNYSADYGSVCRFYPHFIDDAFALLFPGQDGHDMVANGSWEQLELPL